MDDDTDGDASPTDETVTEDELIDAKAEGVLSVLAEDDDSVIDPEAENFGVLVVAVTDSPDADDAGAASLVCVEGQSDEQKDDLHTSLADVLAEQHIGLAAQTTAQLFVE
jgi:hypothetical protein